MPILEAANFACAVVHALEATALAAAASGDVLIALRLLLLVALREERK